MSKLLLNEVFGSGGVLLSKGKVLLIHKATEDEWTLPHSVLGEDQGLRDSAVSEVSKYVKFECSIKDYFGSHVYSTNEGVTHRVFYWIMKSSTGGTTGGTLENLEEIDEVRCSSLLDTTLCEFLSETCWSYTTKKLSSFTTYSGGEG